MDVTKLNWHEAVGQVEAAIRDCDFMAIDAEMTGLPAHLQNPANTSPTSQQTPQTLEAKFRDWRKAASKLLMVQFGLCTFHWNSERRIYLARPFNFYVFPTDDASVPFLSSPASMKFLASRGFDFNRLFVEGLDAGQIALVAQWMVSAKKPLIGHNAFLDVMYLMKSLFSPLPDKMETYRQLLHTCFPIVVDTKYFAVASPAVSPLLQPGLVPGGTPATSLGDLCHLVASMQATTDFDVELDLGFDAYRIHQRYHEAGYDAFMAGVIYARLTHYEYATSIPPSHGGPTGYAEAIAAYINRLWWGRKTLFFACEPREETLGRMIALLRPPTSSTSSVPNSTVDNTTATLPGNSAWVATQLLNVTTTATLDALAKAVCSRVASPTGPTPAAAADLCGHLIRQCAAFQPFLVQRCREASQSPVTVATTATGMPLPGGGTTSPRSNSASNISANSNSPVTMQTLYYSGNGLPPRWSTGALQSSSAVANGNAAPGSAPIPRRNTMATVADNKQFSEFVARVWPQIKMPIGGTTATNNNNGNHSAMGPSPPSSPQTVAMATGGGSPLSAATPAYVPMSSNSPLLHFSPTLAGVMHSGVHHYATHGHNGAVMPHLPHSVLGGSISMANASNMPANVPSNTTTNATAAATTTSTSAPMALAASATSVSAAS